MWHDTDIYGDEDCVPSRSGLRRDDEVGAVYYDNVTRGRSLTDVTPLE